MPNMQTQTLRRRTGYCPLMTHPTPQPVDLSKAVAELEHLGNRKPTTDAQPHDKWAAKVSDYRDGGIFVVDYAGSSEWERHGVGDELVQVIEGSTTMTMHVDGQDQATTMSAGQFIIVPQGVWHRFDTPEGAKIMTITPQPTDHMLEHPSTLD